MSLKTLKPRLATQRTHEVRMLEAKAGTTERIRGGTWMRTRQRVALAHGFACVDCGRAWHPSRDHIDHDTPLEQGGSNDDANLKPRCVECHQVKTTREAGKRWG
jgi:5-methylcytosine-specific restriction protein A